MQAWAWPRAGAGVSQRPSDDGSEQAEVVVRGVEVVGAADEDNVDAGAVLVGAGRGQSGGHGGRREDEQQQQWKRSCGSYLHGRAGLRWQTWKGRASRLARFRALTLYLFRFVPCAHIAAALACSVTNGTFIDGTS